MKRFSIFGLYSTMAISAAALLLTGNLACTSGSGQSLNANRNIILAVDNYVRIRGLLTDDNVAAWAAWLKLRKIYTVDEFRTEFLDYYNFNLDDAYVICWGNNNCSMARAENIPDDVTSLMAFKADFDLPPLGAWRITAVLKSNCMTPVSLPEAQTIYDAQVVENFTGTEELGNLLRQTKTINGALADIKEATDSNPTCISTISTAQVK